MPIFAAFLLSLLAFPSFAETRLALNWRPEPEFGGFYAAQSEGIFKKETGSDVTLIVSGTGQPVTQMVAAGKAEYGISSADEVLLARAKGADVVAIYAVYQLNPQAVMVHEDSGVTSLAELFQRDFTVALQRGLPYTSFLESKFGFAKVKVVPYAGGIKTFLHEKKFAQQCFISSQPISARRSGATPRAFLIADEGFNPYAAVVVTRSDRLKKSPAEVAKMVSAIRQGWNRYLRSPGKTNEVMHRLNDSLDLATYNEAAALDRRLIETPEAKGSSLGKMKLARWTELQEQLLQLKLLDRKTDVTAAFANP